MKENCGRVEEVSATSCILKNLLVQDIRALLTVNHPVKGGFLGAPLLQKDSISLAASKMSMQLQK